MVRNTRRVCRDGVSPQKRDTPVKPVGRRERHRRFLPSKTYEPLPEEPELEEMPVPTVTTTDPVWTSIKPVHCKPVSRLSSPAFTETCRDAAVVPATPANKKAAYQASPVSRQSIQMTPDTISGSDTTFSSDDEDFYSSASSSSSNLPSPEIFRRENDVETVTFPFNKTELLGLHPNIKNSTLLDMSHAQTIHMHQPPNLSAIIDASTILAEKCEMSNNRRREAETQTQTDSFKSDKGIKCKTPNKITKKKPILCKKVIFKSPIVAEITPATTCVVSEPVQTFSPKDQMKPGEETPRAGEVNSEDDTLHLKVTLKRPIKRSSEKAKFFVFDSDSDRDVFFQMMRERCDKLRSAPFFPLTAAEHTVASVL